MTRALSFLIAALCAIPAVLVLISLAVPMPPQTEENWRHVASMLLADYTWTTLQLVLGVASVSAVFGISTAWLVSHYKFPLSSLYRIGLVLPLAVPAYILAIVYGRLLEYAGPVQTAFRDVTHLTRSEYWFLDIRSLSGAICTLGIAFSPYIFLLARAAFQTQGTTLHESARSLGLSMRACFFRVSLPAARPFIAIGLMLVVMETLAEFGAVSLYGVSTLSVGIYRSWFSLQEPLIAARIAGLLLIPVLALLIGEHASRRQAVYNSKAGVEKIARARLQGVAALGASLWCGIPVAIGFAVPFVYLALQTLYIPASDTHPDWLNAGMDSLTVGALGAACVLAAGIAMTLAERRRGRWTQLANRVASIGYAMPGVVVAIGVVLLFSCLDRGFSAFSGGAILTGSFAGLLLAYVMRFIAVSFSPLRAGLERIPAEMEYVAASLGCTKAAIARRVTLPLLKTSMLAAAMLAFIDIVKELPATLILRPYDITPLAVLTYQLAGDDRLSESAPGALAIVAISALSVWVLHKLLKTPA